MTSPITASFNVETGLEDQKVIPIGGPSVIAGNSDAVDLRIDNRFVSRRHFQVRFETDVFYYGGLGQQGADGRVLFSANSANFRSKPLTCGHSASFRDLSACDSVNSSIRFRVSRATSVS